jgi:peroxiredoxin (alkyl hydroperoxide reductase subunit C)
VVLFFYPLDFTFVCPSEIIAFDKKVEKFKNRNCQVIGASVDSHFTHLAWENTPRAEGGIGNVQFPLVNDLPLGRNVDEALRILDALQFTEEHGEVCPANWTAGNEAMKPTAEGVASYLAKHSV